MKKWAILLVFFVGACSTAKPITLPDGRTGQLVQCNGTMNSIAGCYEAAGKVCPFGYDIVDAQQERGRAAVPNGTGGFNVLPTASRMVLVACK